MASDPHPGDVYQLILDAIDGGELPGAVGLGRGLVSEGGMGSLGVVEQDNRTPTAPTSGLSAGLRIDGIRGLDGLLEYMR